MEYGFPPTFDTSPADSGRSSWRRWRLHRVLAAQCSQDVNLFPHPTLAVRIMHFALKSLSLSCYVCQLGMTLTEPSSWGCSGEFTRQTMCPQAGTLLNDGPLSCNHRSQALENDASTLDAWDCALTYLLILIYPNCHNKNKQSSTF